MRRHGDFETLTGCVIVLSKGRSLCRLPPKFRQPAIGQ
jgi:hypothetical protein